MFPAGLKRALLSRAQVSRWTVYALFAGLFITFPTAVVTAPAANAAACVPTSTPASNGDTILTFATVGSCDWSVPDGVISARVLVVGGGGSGIDDRRNWDSYRVNGEVKKLGPTQGKKMMGLLM